MTTEPAATDAERTIRLYPWYRFAGSLLFWQALWFLYFQKELSAADAIVLYVLYDVATTLVEVPSGYLSDRVGRRPVLIASAILGFVGVTLLAIGGGFWIFAAGQLLLGAGMAFSSGTDTSLLYESLRAAGRTEETERWEVTAWRFSFTGLALSAVTGGAMALWDDTVPFIASAVAAGGVIVLVLRLAEPPRILRDEPALSQFGALRRSLLHPVLGWLFVLSLLMYAFSHVPFVFGQPFILSALAGIGLDGDAPAVSGAVTTLMMVISLGVSWVAPGLRRRIGLGPLLLTAFGMQITLIALLAATNSVIAILFLLFRMVPDSLSRPFILARIQPLLGDEMRSTYISLRSLAGRLVLAGTLAIASAYSPGEGEMPWEDMRWILGVYAGSGLAAVVALALMARRIALDPARTSLEPDS